MLSPAKPRKAAEVASLYCARTRVREAGSMDQSTQRARDWPLVSAGSSWVAVCNAWVMAMAVSIRINLVLSRSVLPVVTRAVARSTRIAFHRISKAGRAAPAHAWAIGGGMSARDLLLRVWVRCARGRRGGGYFWGSGRV